MGEECGRMGIVLKQTKCQNGLFPARKSEMRIGERYRSITGEKNVQQI